MRSFARLGALASTVLCGCAFFPDFKNSPVYHAPIAEVVNQIRCDMYDFLRTQKHVINPTFSLDFKSYATVELTLSTTAYGEVKFAKIDTARLGAAGFLAIGSASQPFPTLSAKQLNQTVAKVTINVSQDPDKLKGACEYGRGEIFSSSPHADQVLVNDLRISEWLKRSFDNAQRINAQLPVCNSRPKPTTESSACSVGLETAVLISKFQLVADASAGVLDLAKLIPIIATPTLQLNMDYYHQIQIIFSGNNRVVASKATNYNVLSRGAGGGDDDFNESLLQQLRSIRDATILNGQPR